jgi:sulfite oxidase
MKKDPNLIVHTTAPINAEPPLAKLREYFITPLNLFYLRNHGDFPEIDSKKYHLVVNGMVEQELELSLDTLMNDFQKYTVMATLQCAGNRRDQLIAEAPIPGEVPWQSGAIGNAEWSGVRLKNVLNKAGIKSEACYVEFMGAEEVIRHGENVGFGASISIDKAMNDEVLLAYEMNGKTLEAGHGFPLRAVVPGYIGARSVKWLTRITLQDKPSENYFQSHAYQLFPPHESAETVDWSSGLQLSELGVNCVITCPEEGDKVNGKKIKIEGYAMSGGGKKITQVDVSNDCGKTWTTATITEGNEPWAWAFWEAILELKSGEHEIVARAFDSESNTQPEHARHIWNFKGYMNNAWHRVKIFVK